MEEDLVFAIGLELYYIRKLKGYSKTEVSKKANVSIGTITNYENSKVPMKLYLLNKILDFYGVESSIFFKMIYDRLQRYKGE